MCSGRNLERVQSECREWDRKGDTDLPNLMVHCYVGLLEILKSMFGFPYQNFWDSVLSIGS